MTQQLSNRKIWLSPRDLSRMSLNSPTSDLAIRSAQGHNGSSDNSETSGSLVEPRIPIWKVSWTNKADLEFLYNLRKLVECHHLKKLSKDSYTPDRVPLDSTGEEISTEAPALEAPRPLGGTDQGDK